MATGRRISADKLGALVHMDIGPSEAGQSSQFGPDPGICAQIRADTRGPGCAQFAVTVQCPHLKPTTRSVK